VEATMVLLVEDNKDLAETVGDYLEAADFTVDYAYDGPSAIMRVSQERYDAVVLDLGLPGVDGLEVLRSLRDKVGKDTPVIILTARDGNEEKLAGFEAGCDDYLVKPVHLPELEVRLIANIRRSRGEVVHGTFKVSDLCYNVKTSEVTRGGQLLQLSPTCLKILRILMRESPNVVSRQAIEAELWGDDLPDSDTLRSHLYKIRKAVDRPFQHSLIHTIQGVGIRLVDRYDASAVEADQQLDLDESLDDANSSFDIPAHKSQLEAHKTAL